MKKIILFFVALLPLAMVNVAMAQSSNPAADAYKQKQEEYLKFKKERQQKYQKFLEEINSEYEQFIRQKWQSFNGNDAVKKPKSEPEPDPVIYDDKEPKPIDDRQLTISIEDTPEPLPEPKPVVIVKEVPVAVEKTVDILFYGAKLSFRYDRADNVSLASTNENDVADAWHSLSDGRMNNLMRDCFEERQKRDLCDWAYFQMVDQLVSEIYKDANERAVVENYILCQSGFKSLLGKDENKRLYFLVATSSDLYNRTYWIVNDEHFYSLTDNMDNVMLEILPQSFPEAKSLRLEVSGANRIGVNLSETRHLKSEDFPRVEVDVRSNKNLMKFYETYPSGFSGGNYLTKWWFYAMTPMDENTASVLYPSLKKCMAGASEKEKVSMLLNFVQTAFIYGYDSEIWGDDRAFFAEETLYYPYSDCEDRSILFSRLVRDLVGLDVVLIYYPGHLATAVAFNEDVNGDYLLIGGRRFTVCDPTYIHAPIGLTMPGMDNSKAMAIAL